MAKYNQDFILPANDGMDLRFENIINETTGALITVGDIMGATWGMTPFETETTPLIEKSLSGGTIETPEDGVVVVKIFPSDTEGLSGEFTHELRLLSATIPHTAARGKMTIKYQVVSNPI